ncbi:hypothetical protein C5167_014320 [Papaver somniferum]|uniref:Drought induced 19 protein type zinc-binding domain-containing protein n=1 Tax=Papaver somniferum TaxID=3469 RepID=A0A4Y7J2T8_PAPSO|nr:hypothetical protein C5167_014320 [Papaver somniferum]
MDSDSWSDSLSTSKRYQSRNDLYNAYEEYDSDDEPVLPMTEFPCPFCSEDFDIIGLCCHIDDEHPVEAKTGECPVCGLRVGMDMIAHITMQHGQTYIQRRKKLSSKGGSLSTLSQLKKELREGNLQSLLGGSSGSVSSVAPDPLLSSFMYNMPTIEEPASVNSQSSDESNTVEETSDEHLQERNVEPSPPLSDKDQEEKASRSQFVQGMLLSMMFDDIL